MVRDDTAIAGLRISEYLGIMMGKGGELAE